MSEEMYSAEARETIATLAAQSAYWQVRAERAERRAVSLIDVRDAAEQLARAMDSEPTGLEQALLDPDVVSGWAALESALEEGASE